MAKKRIQIQIELRILYKKQEIVRKFPNNIATESRISDNKISDNL